jgi:hypothetical protein
MINFLFKPSSYPLESGDSCLLAKLTYPESQWGEVIFIYAHTSKNKIDLEGCDFYGNEIILKPSCISEPLSLEEIIRMIETLSVQEEGENYKFSLKYSGIPEVESSIYPNINLYFEEKRKTFGLD